MPAHAQGVIADKSEIAFTMTQMGVRFDGRFRKWKAEVVFQPNALAASRGAFDVELGAGNRIAEGRFSIGRLDYKVGEGEWADTMTVENDIIVRVRMLLAPAG